MISDEYAAGFFDGEGTVFAATRGGSNKSPTIMVLISNTVREPLDLLQQKWGGSICITSPRKANHRPVHQWAIAARKAAPFLRAIEPHCIIKRNVVRVAIEYCALMALPAHERIDYSTMRPSPSGKLTKSGKVKMTRGGTVRPEIRERVMLLHQEIRRLNCRGAPHNGKRAYANSEPPTQRAESDAA